MVLGLCEDGGVGGVVWLWSVCVGWGEGGGGGVSAAPGLPIGTTGGAGGGDLWGAGG